MGFLTLVGIIALGCILGKFGYDFIKNGNKDTGMTDFMKQIELAKKERDEEKQNKGN